MTKERVLSAFLGIILLAFICTLLVFNCSEPTPIIDTGDEPHDFHEVVCDDAGRCIVIGE